MQGRQDSPREAAIKDATRMLNNMELPYLLQLRIALNETIEERQREARVEGIRKIREIVAKIGVDIGWILAEQDPAGSAFGQKLRALVPIKYVDPRNPNHRWSGRGTRPHWYREFLQHGGTEEQMQHAAKMLNGL